MTEHCSANDDSNNINKKLALNRFYELVTKYYVAHNSYRNTSTGKRPKAGRANFQHQELTGKGNVNKMSKKKECGKLGLLA